MFDVAVIGAGASGLLAALEIALTDRRVAVIEAKNRLGGRMFTIVDDGLPVELGAEFVHGNLALTKLLLRKAGAKTYEAKGSFWQHKNGGFSEQGDVVADYSALASAGEKLQHDKPVNRFLNENLGGTKNEALRFSLHNYVQGYYAADTARASAKALCEELTKGEDEQYRIEEGYAALVHYLEGECRKKGVQFFLSQPVRELRWKSGEVVVITDQASFHAAKVLITVSIGVLQKEKILFSPDLPQVKKAAEALGFGHVVKASLQFASSFWKDKTLTSGKDLTDLGFLFSEEDIPTWWTHHPKKDNVLVAWLGGPKAAALRHLDKDEAMAKAISSLGRIFGLGAVHLQQNLIKAHCYNWSADEEVCGAYSYAVVGGADAAKQLQEPVEKTIFFAGEGLHQGPEIGTVEGALVNGRETAYRLIASFDRDP